MAPTSAPASVTPLATASRLDRPLASSRPSDAAPRWTVLHAVLTSELAGAERYCIELANRQAELGHRVHVAGQARGPLSGALHPDVQFHPIGLPWRRSQRLARMAQVAGAEVFHAHLSGACKAMPFMPANVARVATLHVGYKPHQHDGADGLVCVNRQQVMELGRYAGMHRRIPNWLPERVAPVPGAAEALRRELGIPTDSVVVLGVGRLHASKGMDLLIEAFQAGAGDDDVLLIAGQGREARALRRLAAGDKRIRLLGFRSDIGTLMAAATLFVCPSREETFGLATLEAMLEGLPIIASATTGSTELLTGQPAKLVPIDDLWAMSRALHRALKGLRGAGLQRLPYLLSPYQAANSVQSMLDFYGELVSCRREQRLALRLSSQVAHA